MLYTFLSIYKPVLFNNYLTFYKIRILYKYINIQGCLSMSCPSWQDIELDDVGRQLEAYPYLRMRLHAGGALVV